MNEMKRFVTVLLVMGTGIAASAGVLDDAVFRVTFNDTFDDINGAVSTGSVPSGHSAPSYTNDAAALALTNASGKVAEFNRSTTNAVDYGLGINSELKVEGSLTYHMRVKFNSVTSGNFEFPMGRIGNGEGERVSYIYKHNAIIHSIFSPDGTADDTRQRDVGGIESNKWYDVFVRFQADPDESDYIAEGWHEMSVFEVGTNIVSSSGYYSTHIEGLFDTNAIPFRIGNNDWTGNSNPFDGYMEQVNVWTTALTSAQMAEISGGPLVPDPPVPPEPITIDDAVFSVHFGGDSINDLNTIGGGISTGTGNNMTFTDVSAMPNSNERGAVFNGTDSYIDYSLGAGNELKIEGSLTYHIRVKFDTKPQWHFLMGRWGGDADNNRVSTILGNYANVHADASLTNSYDTARRRTVSNAFPSNTWYDVFYRFHADPDGAAYDSVAEGFHVLTVYETGDAGSANASDAYATQAYALYDTTNVLFRVGASRHTAASPHAPIDGTVDQVNVWTNSLGIGDMQRIVAGQAFTTGAATILDVSKVPGSDVLKIVVDAPGNASRYAPIVATDLVAPSWGSVAHSTNGLPGTFETNNLAYSSTDATGTNEVIYVEADAAKEFFKIEGE